MPRNRRFATVEKSYITVIQVSSGACNGTVLQGSLAVLHGYFLSAQLVGSILHTGGHHGITDQYNSLLVRTF